MSEVSANEQIGQRLRLLRTEKGVSQKEAAAALGVSQSMLSHYEQGLRECSMASLFAACTYYEVSADYLLGLEAERNRNQQAPQKDNVFRGTTYAVLLKNTVANAAGLLFDLLNRADAKELALEIGHFLSMSLYKLFRRLYSGNPENPGELFSLSEEEWNELISVEMILSEMRLKTMTAQADQKPFAPNVSELSSSFPQETQAMLRLIRSCEEKLKKN